jgi:hypothetical protein
MPIEPIKMLKDKKIKKKFNIFELYFLQDLQIQPVFLLKLGLWVLGNRLIWFPILISITFNSIVGLSFNFVIRF